MADEKKEEAATQQATAQAEQPKPGPTGLDRITAKDLKELYARSPQMFEEAEIVKKEEEKKKDATKVDKKEAPPDKSAAPLSMDGVEIKVPEDVPVDIEAVKAHIEHSKSIGLTPKQVQAQIDVRVEAARKAIAAQPKPKTQEQIDAENDAKNVALLKGEFGEKYEENMEIARQAAVEFGDADLLKRLKSSDPVLVRHLLKIGLKNKEGTTPKGGQARTGNEEEDERKKHEASLKGRYNRSPQMFGEGPK